MRLRVGTADGLFALDGSPERQVAGHSVTALSEDWAIFDGETVVYRANGSWRQTFTVRSPERSLGVHGALLSRSDEAIVGWPEVRVLPAAPNHLLVPTERLTAVVDLLPEWRGLVSSPHVLLAAGRWSVRTRSHIHGGARSADWSIDGCARYASTVLRL